MPRGDFAAGAFTFRGGATGPMNPTDPGGTAVDISGDPTCAYAPGRPAPRVANGGQVDISGDPTCAYAAVLKYQTRHYVTGAPELEVYYCKD